MRDRNVDPSGQTSHHLPAADADRSDAADAARYRWLAKQARLQDTGNDGGGWVGAFLFPFIPAYSRTPFAKKRGAAYDHATLDAAIDAAIESMEKP